jgi:murein DD-endopeptidase MepM/ murein hydrolase activator NlpD
MQIILLHPRFTKARSVTLTFKHWFFFGLLFVVSVMLGAVLLFYMTLSRGAASNLPLVQSLLPNQSAGIATQAAGKDRYVKENLAAMAIKIGEMQAQLMRLDALGERVQGLSGVKPQEFNFREPPGRGGAAPASTIRPPLPELSISQFQNALDALASDVEHRYDYLSAVETTLMFDKIHSKMLPTIQPVNVTYNASGFGWRFDPFTGRSAFHEGIDFPAPTGTPIIAAAGGVVIAAEFHHDFGNMLEIDHGNDIVTRYAHASKLLVKVGDIVQRGQHVADIGSTGRSTGPHLHFEVMVKGSHQDPHKFLMAGVDKSVPSLAARR